jgi:hypothetical protein
MVSPGYDLYVPRKGCRAFLEDVEGRIVHEWTSALSCDDASWRSAELLPDGDLMVWGGEGLNRYDWDGNPRWTSPEILHSISSAHHDVEWLESGELLSLQRGATAVAGYRDGATVSDNLVFRLSADGEVLSKISLLDVLLHNHIGYEVTDPVWRGKPVGDLLHTNSIEVMRRPELASRDRIYELGNILVSMRWQHAIAIIDPGEQELLWVWGPGVIEGQHDASVLDNGNILLFDNGVFRKWSRVIEVDPLTKEIVWTYGAPNGRDYIYTLARGGAQRLPNGNTLITISNEGAAREVTREGWIVWEWHNPNLSAKHRRYSIFRVVRYPPEWIEPLLAAGARPPA